MIEVQDLHKRYGAKMAVDGLSFIVQPGVVTGFLGPNGAGKSTTMRLILGLDRPTEGTALIGGKPHSQSREALHQVGALLDAKDINGGRSAYNHLLALAQSNGIGRRRVKEVLDLVGIAAVAKQRSRGFSLGMSQRLGIAATMLGDPPVLMFDEPVNGLDPGGILWIRNFMKSLAAEGRTVLVSSHLMSEMAVTAERLIIIGKGKLLADTTTEDFLEQSSTNHVRVRSPQLSQLQEALESAGYNSDPADGQLQVHDVTCAQVGDLAFTHRIPIYELFEERASLEQAFMEMTGESVEYQAGLPPPPEGVPAAPAPPAPASAAQPPAPPAPGGPS